MANNPHKKLIKILQNTTIQKASLNNVSNSPNPNRTTSFGLESFLEGEEPVFSDSDEEFEYLKRASLGANCIKSRTKYSSFSRTNCTANEQKILDAVRKCAAIDTDINSDFKEFIYLCKQLLDKYNSIARQSPVTEDINTMITSTTKSPTEANELFTKEFTVSQSGTTMYDVESDFIRRKSMRRKRPTISRNCGVFIASPKIYKMLKQEVSDADGTNRYIISNKIFQNNSKDKSQDISEGFPQRPRKTGESAENPKFTNKKSSRKKLGPKYEPKPIQHRHKRRFLYSPEKWLQSNEITILYKE